MKKRDFGNNLPVVPIAIGIICKQALSLDLAQFATPRTKEKYSIFCNSIRHISRSDRHALLSNIFAVIAASLRALRENQTNEKDLYYRSLYYQPCAI
jgi:hypothetical protein